MLMLAYDLTVVISVLLKKSLKNMFETESKLMQLFLFPLVMKSEPCGYYLT